MFDVFCIFAAATALLAGATTYAADAPPSPAAILQDLRSFDELGSVLYVAAHPDDENTQLITYLARGRGYRTAYLSVTRGDGGQNVLGPEFGPELGVIRTQELLAARRLDGGQQFFTRALDFGFSKDYQETLRIWDRQQVVADIVRVIRTFRPDVVVTRFPPYPTGTHGHHTASAFLAVEAFKLCGDTNAFPDQHLAPWQPKRIFMNGFGGGRRGGGGGDATPAANTVRMESGGNDPVSGESFGAIAARSRSMHKTQGFDNFAGFRGGGGPQTESFQLLAGEPATNGIMDGIDTTWGRFPGGAEVGQLTDQAIAQFSTNDPAASVPALLAIHAKLATLPADPVIDEKRRQFDRILQACLGLTIGTSVTDPEAVPGEKLSLRHTALEQSSVPVRWVAVRYPATGREVSIGIDLHPGQEADHESTPVLPPNTPVTQPYWLRDSETAGMFRVEETSLIGQAQNPPAFPVEQVFEAGGQTLVLSDQPFAPVSDPVKQPIPRRLDVIAPVSLKFADDLTLFAPGATRTVSVKVTAARAGSKGTLHLEVPDKWKVSPGRQSFSLNSAGATQDFEFKLTAPKMATNGEVRAVADIGGKRYDNQRIAIAYPHIPLQLLQPPAEMKALSLDLATRGHAIGYLPGAGDSVDDALKDMGYSVTELTDADLDTNRLKQFDAVVIGVRAANVRSNLSKEMPPLFDYVQNGGVVVEQYNQFGRLRATRLAPYSLQLSGNAPDQRVTDETAPMTFLAPDHPVLNTPNKITSADFNGWIQERGIYFPSDWSPSFTPILACNDPGEAPLKGGLLVAQYGRGYFVYTGLVFFRELPAGVPGAFRLFANLVSLGASESGAAGATDGAK